MDAILVGIQAIEQHSILRGNKTDRTKLWFAIQHLYGKYKQFHAISIPNTMVLPQNRVCPKLSTKQ